MIHPIIFKNVIKIVLELPTLLWLFGIRHFKFNTTNVVNFKNKYFRMYKFYNFVKIFQCNMGRFVRNEFSKGGILGALLGTLASTQVHRAEDSNTRKALKTTLFAGAGFGLGVLVEKWLKRRV
jgi:hypothetical protein